MKRSIKKVAVLGSGVMGSRIACHFAGIGVQVLLLDIVPTGVAADAKPAERNKIVNDALAAAIKSNPSPVYDKNVVNFSATMSSVSAVHRRCAQSIHSFIFCSISACHSTDVCCCLATVHRYASPYSSMIFSLFSARCG